MSIPQPNPNTKRIKSREAMIQYKKALAAQIPWDGGVPIGEGPFQYR